MKIAVNAGHAGDTGAVANGQVESRLNAVMADALMTRGRELGQTMVNATTGGGYPKDINDAVRIVNNSGVDLAISNHFNAGRGTGVEVLYYPGNTAMKQLAAKISAAIAAAYGFPDRGAVPRSNLGFLSMTKPGAVLIEWGFIDAPGNADVPKIMADPKLGANAVFKALGVTSFLAGITGDGVIIRSGPGSNYADTQQRVNTGEIFTIVATEQGQGGNGTWYKLKSGAGWISAAYARPL